MLLSWHERCSLFLTFRCDRVAGSACASQLTTGSTRGVTEPTLIIQIGSRTSQTVRAVARTRWNCAWVAMAMPASTGAGTTTADRMLRLTITIRPPRSNSRFSARATHGRVLAVAGTKSALAYFAPQVNLKRVQRHDLFPSQQSFGSNRHTHAFLTIVHRCLLTCGCTAVASQRQIAYRAACRSRTCLSCSCSSPCTGLLP